MRRTIWILLAAAAVSVTGLSAQETARARAQRMLDAPVFADLATLAASVAAEGIPEEPLFAKALEGAAKRVPPDRLVPAVRNYAVRLGQARLALGVDAEVPLLVAGADALQRGVPTAMLRSFPADRPRSPMALLVLAELVESGVPADRALAIVREVMAQRRDERMLDASARVRMLIRQGMSPADAVERVRALMRDRSGYSLPSGTQLTPRQRIRLRDN